VTVALSSGAASGSVRLLVAEGDITGTVTERRVRFEVPTVVDHEVVVIE
jgi:hypothetical protein